MTIEILSIPGCPNHERTIERVRSVLLSESIEADVKEIVVHSITDEHASGFHGSPTVRINGEDVEPLPASEPALACRIYSNGSGIPPEESLIWSIRVARNREAI